MSATLPLLIQLPTNVYPGRQQVTDTQVPCTQAGQADGRHLGNESTNAKYLCVYACMSLSLYVSDKMKIENSGAGQQPCQP